MQDESKYREGMILFDRGLYAEAAGPFLAGAESGDPEAQNKYGFLCKAGLGVPKDLARAQAWYQKAAEQGHADAAHNLGVLLVERDGRAGVPAALQWFQANANLGHAASQLQLGHLYRTGVGVEANLSEALRLMRAAAAQGLAGAAFQVSLADRYGASDHKGPYPSYAACEARAQDGDAAASRLLGAYCMLGYGCKPDPQAARQWIERAAIAEDVPAMRALGMFRFDENAGPATKDWQAAQEDGDVEFLRENWSLADHETAFAIGLWEQAADAGDALAMYFLALSYFDGKAGAVDPARAMRLLESAAEKGCVDALVVMADHYRIGESIEKDMDLAVHWYKRAAQAGHIESMFYLGLILADGIGVAAEISMGVHWLESAASKGWADAQCNLGIRHLQGDGVEVDLGAGATWLRKAVEQEHLHATYSLGVCYRNGEGVPQDSSFGEHLWRKAARRGHAGSAAALEVLVDDDAAPLVDLAKDWTPPFSLEEMAAVPSASQPVETSTPPSEQAIASSEADSGVASRADPATTESGPEPSLATLVTRMKWSQVLAEAALLLLIFWIASWFWEPILPYMRPAGWTVLGLFVFGSTLRPSSELMGHREEAIEALGHKNPVAMSLKTAGLLAVWTLVFCGADLLAWSQEKFGAAEDSAQTANADAEDDPDNGDTATMEGADDTVDPVRAGSVAQEISDSFDANSSSNSAPGAPGEPYTILVGPAGTPGTLFVYLQRYQVIEGQISDADILAGEALPPPRHVLVGRTEVIEVPYTIAAGHQGAYAGESDTQFRGAWEVANLLGDASFRVFKDWQDSVMDVREGESVQFFLFLTRPPAEAKRAKDRDIRTLPSPPTPDLD